MFKWIDTLLNRLFDTPETGVLTVDITPDLTGWHDAMNRHRAATPPAPESKSIPLFDEWVDEVLNIPLQPFQREALNAFSSQAGLASFAQLRLGRKGPHRHFVPLEPTPIYDELQAMADLEDENHPAPLGTAPHGYTAQGCRA